MRLDTFDRRSHATPRRLSRRTLEGVNLGSVLRAALLGVDLPVVVGAVPGPADRREATSDRRRAFRG
jgi:hypothetical protein